MQVIVGLGNPGKEYHNTRHNVGFIFTDYVQRTLQSSEFKLQKKHDILVSESTSCILIKPQTFMNKSGLAIRSYLEYYNKNWQEKLDTLYIAHDDLDLEFGAFKIQFGKGPKVHNGLLSTYNHLRTQEFWHIRIGVDSRGGSRNISGSEYVLSPFSSEELKLLENTFKKISHELSL